VAKVLLVAVLAPSGSSDLSSKFRNRGCRRGRRRTRSYCCGVSRLPSLPVGRFPGGQAVLPRESSTVAANGQADAPRRATSHVEKSAGSLRHPSERREPNHPYRSILLSRKWRCSAPVRRAGRRAPRSVRTYGRSRWCGRSRRRVARGRRGVLDLDSTTRSRLPVRLCGRRTGHAPNCRRRQPHCSGPEVPTVPPGVGFRAGTGLASPAEPRWQLVRCTRALSEFWVRSAESTGICRWESMTPGDHPAEEREAGTLAPALPSAATVRHS
jgi:hypothetical protein